MNESFIHDKPRPRARSRPGLRRDPRKLAAIAGAACHVLSAQGPRLTQMADVARTAGVATGTVYLYVAEKDALMELALLSAARLDLPKGEKPVAFSARRLNKVGATAIAERLRWPVLHAAAAGAPTADTLPAVVGEVYDMLASEKRLIGLLDRCAREVPILQRLYIDGARHRFFTDLETCMRRLSAAGHVRRDIDMAAAARATLEMLVWMAMRRDGDPEPPHCDDQTARQASLALAVAGLAARE